MEGGRDDTRFFFERPVTRREVLRRGGAAALGLTIGGNLLAACGGDDDDEEAGASGEVTFWTEHTEPDLGHMKKMVQTYNQESGGQVKLVSVTGSETDIAKLTTAVRGGTGPDIYLLDRFTVAQRAEQGIISDLSDFMEGDDGVDAYKDRYLDFAWAEVEFEGRPYALPFDTDARGLWFNRGLLQQSGVDPAELDPDNGPLTLDQVREMARKVDKEDAGGYSQVGFIPWADQGWHYTWGFTFGGDFYDEGGCQVTPTDDGVVAGFQFLYDWAKEMDPKKAQAFLSAHAACSGPMTCNFVSPQESWPFLRGIVGMTVIGDWPISWMRDFGQDIDWGVTYIPVPEEGDESATWAGGWSVVIPDGAKNPEGAWEFMKWFAGNAGQKAYSESSAHLPTIKELSEDESLFDEQHQFFRTLLDVANSRPPLPVGALYWDELTAAQEAVVLNQKQPMEALETAKSRTQAQLQKFC
jgi:multiple sugar transport system substrate-binding protein